MRFFNRNKGAANAPPATATGSHHRKSKGVARQHDEPFNMSTRPRFGQWLKATILDLVTMAAMGAVGLGVYNADPAPSRSFPVRFSDGEIVWPQFGYPLRDEIIPIWLAAFLASIIPIVVILLMQIRIRSFWDVNNGIIGLLYSLITAAVFQVFIKWLIGGLRPHFLDVCKPDISKATHKGNNGAGYLEIYYTPDICTGDKNKINDALESMPSGHTTAAFAGFVFLYLYLNGKLKVFSNYHPAMWKLIVLYMPILGAVLIGGALTIDEFHNWYDVLAGATIGTVMAFSAYRMTYASVWDWRYNHIPLNRGAAFGYSAGGADLMDAVFTRRAGWGGHGHGFGHGNGGHGDGFVRDKHAHGAHGPVDGPANSTIPRRPVHGTPPEQMV